MESDAPQNKVLAQAIQALKIPSQDMTASSRELVSNQQES